MDLLQRPQYEQSSHCGMDLAKRIIIFFSRILAEWNNHEEATAFREHG